MLCALVSFIADNDSGKAIDVEAEIKDADWVFAEYGLSFTEKQFS
jgi:hypothetical protein